MVVQNLRRHLRNVPGWRTKRRIVVIESDDWGSIRMPSRDAFKRLKNMGVDLESGNSSRYGLYDTLANHDDLERLFEVLDSVEDKYGNPSVFTAVCVVANPDFVKIRENNFQEYYYEPFTKTLERYYPGENIFELWKYGIKKNLFVPQFHGREHLNVAAWLKALRMDDKNTSVAFDEGMWGFVPISLGKLNVKYQAAFQLTDISDIAEHKKIIIEGLSLFESLFGFRAKYFVPPNGAINNSLNRVLSENGIKFRSAAKLQNESIDLGKTRKVFHWLGQRDVSSLVYINRNCLFEPSSTGKDWIDSCLNDINIAFKWEKPAIINSHRVNYIGSHYPSNRDSSLRALKTLLTAIKKNWPDIEFMSTDKFGELMNQ
ncbi:MAG: polysaccharide (de)acetylase [Clostridiaceae bacterium]|nr:polysaccharide (de)acetylase [Clostridiaceae bacterium]